MISIQLMLCLAVVSGLGTRGAFAFSSKRPAVAQDASPLAAAQVWITRADGAQSCSTRSGQSLEEAAADLRNAKVRVLESRKGNDGKMHMQMCGAPSGTTNAFLIPKDDLPQAVAQGYIQAH